MPERIKIGRFAMAGAASLLIALGVANESHADIFKWVDDQGTLHFTDDPSTIPASKREQTGTPFIKEPPRGASPVETPSQPAQSAVEPASPPAVISTDSGENQDEAIAREIEQQKAKIAAKESLIRYVDEKRSLATNPLRNRVVSAADLELYEKYKIELPGDIERLRRLESRLPSQP